MSAEDPRTDENRVADFDHATDGRTFVSLAEAQTIDRAIDHLTDDGEPVYPNMYAIEITATRSHIDHRKSEQESRRHIAKIDADSARLHAAEAKLAVREKERALNGVRADLAYGRPIRLMRAGTKPYIDVDQTKIKESVDYAERALAELDRVYVRARTLVEVVEDRAGADWLKRPKGAPVIVPIAPERLRELLGEAAFYISFVDGKKKQVAAPLWIVKTLLAREAWSLPVIEGVTDSPVLRQDGTVLDVEGYDDATRLIYVPPEDVTYPPIPASPTKADAEAALLTLAEVFADFPFVAASDLGAAIALVLSLVGRAAIDGVVPMFLATAPTPGSGKGLIVDACAMIATGRAAPKMAPTSDDEETRKRLLAIALAGDPIVTIDNVEGALGSASLAMAITSGVISERVLGLSKNVTASLRAVWTATGNNVELRGDLGRRVIPIGLDPAVENPEDRTDFRIPELLGHVREQRPRLVTAAITILRAYVVAGKPRHGMSRKGSFEAWDDLIRGAVIWASDGIENDPVAGVARIREAGDADKDHLRDLLGSWRAVFGDRAVTVADAIGEATRIVSPGVGDDRAALRDALAEYGAKAGQLDAKLIGYALRRLKGRIVGDMSLRLGTKTRRGATWVVVG